MGGDEGSAGGRLAKGVGKGVGKGGYSCDPNVPVGVEIL